MQIVIGILAPAFGRPFPQRNIGSIAVDALFKHFIEAKQPCRHSCAQGFDPGSSHESFASSFQKGWELESGIPSWYPGSAGVLSDLFVQLLKERIETFGFEKLVIICTFEGKVAYAVRNDVDDSPLPVHRAQDIVEGNLSATDLIIWLRT